MLLPLLADKDSSVRGAVHETDLVLDLPSPLMQRLAALPADPDDAAVDYLARPQKHVEFLAMDELSLAPISKSAGGEGGDRFLHGQVTGLDSNAGGKAGVGVGVGVGNVPTAQAQGDAQASQQARIETLLATVDTHLPAYYSASAQDARVAALPTVAKLGDISDAFLLQLHQRAARLPPLPTDRFDEAEYILRELFALRGSVGAAAAVVLASLCSGLSQTAGSSLLRSRRARTCIPTH
jgi:hypothetical protein